MYFIAPRTQEALLSKSMPFTVMICWETLGLSENHLYPQIYQKRENRCNLLCNSRLTNTNKNVFQVLNLTTKANGMILFGSSGEG